MASVSYGISFWLPTTILSQIGLTSGPRTQLLNIPTAVLSIICTLTTSWFIDRDTRIPRPVIIYCACLCLISCFMGVIFCTNSVDLYLLIMVSD